MLRKTVLVVACLMAAAGGALAQQAPAKVVAPAIPRTADGRPDFGGIWSSWFLTPMERPKDVTSLVVSEGEAKTIVAKRLAGASSAGGGVGVDPDSRWSGVDELLKINGQYRSSLVTEPADGKLPYTPEAKHILDMADERFNGPVDNPEIRGMSERCIGLAGIPPMAIMPNFNMRQIILSRDAMMIHSEEGMDTRIIPINALHRPAGVANYLGDSVAWWEGDTLAVETLGVDEEPEDEIVLPTSRVIERFSLLGPDEILYRFTVEDPVLYDKPWSAEFTLKRSKLKMFEAACHEGDESLRAMLMGARIDERRPKKTDAQKLAATRIAVEVICGPAGRCPSYKLELLPDGQFRYEGVRDADPMGVRDDNLGPAAFAKAEAAFTTAKWADLADDIKPDKEGPCRTDALFVRITRNADGKTDKTVNYNLGCDSEAAHVLYDALLAIMPRPVAGNRSPTPVQ